MKEHKLIIKLKLDQRVKLKIMNKFFDQVKLVFQYYDQSKFCCDLLPIVNKFLFLM